MDLLWHELNSRIQVKNHSHAENNGFGCPWFSKKHSRYIHPLKPAEAEPSFRKPVNLFPTKLSVFFPTHLKVREFWPQIYSLD